MKFNFVMMMKVIKINPQTPNLKLLQEAADIILDDGVIGYPTETVYGLGANALSGNAIEKVFQLKRREKNKPILVIASNLDKVKELVSFFPETAELLAQYFWPGPLTIIFKAAAHLTKSLLGDGNSIGIRIPDNRICLELLKICKIPLTSTSANLAGEKNPISADEVIDNFSNELELVIDGGLARSTMSSTVLDLSTEKSVLMREGVIKKIEIEQIIGSNVDEIKRER